jgi:hypothetical protein
VEETRPSTWGELHEVLFADTWDEGLRRFRGTQAFRGRDDAAEPLLTSLARLGGDAAALEAHLLRAFRKYARRAAAAPSESVWDWLALAQHHGLPTRLLDWTYSPYVALHFATAEPALFDRDGVVWCVDYAAAHREAPERLAHLLADEAIDVFTAELLDRVAPGLGELERLDGDFVVFLEPPSLDERIVNQYALFSLLSRADADLSEWLAARPGTARRVVVPGELKWEVRDKLDQANVTERVLFPGLDGLSRWLTRYYAPR